MSIAVWDVPFPTVIGAKFRPKVGVRCSAECNLADEVFEIYDQAGGRVATGTLGGIPWPDTESLYWAEVELEAPGAEGYHEWTVKVPETDLERPHAGASYTLGILTARPPEHWVTVEVFDKETEAPMVNAEVILHPYSGRTNEHGVARIGVPKGKYEVYISERGKKIFRSAIEVAGDAAVKAEVLSVPPDLEMS